MSGGCFCPSASRSPHNLFFHTHVLLLCISIDIVCMLLLSMMILPSTRESAHGHVMWLGTNLLTPVFHAYMHRALGDVGEGLNGWHTPVFHPYLDTRTRVQLPAWGIAWTHHGLNGWHPFHSIWPRRPMMTLQHAVHQVAAAMLGGVAIATARHSRPRRKSMMMCMGKGGSFAAASFVRSGWLIACMALSPAA